MITKSGLSARTIRSASSPPRASSKRYPRSRSSVATKRRLTGLSSMIRIVATTSPISMPGEPASARSRQQSAKWIIMPLSCVNTGNENVTEGEPKGGGREAVAGASQPGGAKPAEVHMQDKGSRLAVLTPTHIGQTSAGSPETAPPTALHCSALNHLTADASSRKL